MTHPVLPEIVIECLQNEWREKAQAKTVSLGDVPYYMTPRTESAFGTWEVTRNGRRVAMITRDATLGWYASLETDAGPILVVTDDHDLADEVRVLEAALRHRERLGDGFSHDSHGAPVEQTVRDGEREIGRVARWEKNPHRWQSFSYTSPDAPCERCLGNWDDEPTAREAVRFADRKYAEGMA